MRTLGYLLGSVICLISMCAVGTANADQVTYLEPQPINATKSVGLLPSEKFEFNPSRGEIFDIGFAVGHPASVNLALYSADGDLIRELITNTSFDTGNHTTSWDGLDVEGMLVPDEVYIPVIELKFDSTTLIDDSRRYSGGEIIPNIDWTLGNETELSFELEYPARGLIRTGVQDGPMMRELMHWQPVVPGKTVIRWDGYDKDDVEAFANRDDIWFVVMAYRTPEYSIITSGNDNIDYRTYREGKRWPVPKPDMTAIELQRNGIRLEQDYFLPRAFSPEVVLGIAKGAEPSRVGIPTVADVVSFQIDVPERDRWILDTTFYETSFYIDFKFQSEEEQGFVPLIWKYDASALEPGRHTATVQLFGFGGFISSDTVEFLVTP